MTLRYSPASIERKEAHWRSLMQRVERHELTIDEARTLHERFTHDLFAALRAAESKRVKVRCSDCGQEQDLIGTADVWFCSCSATKRSRLDSQR